MKIIGPSESSAIIQGPGTKTVIKGPDGSVISTVADAGGIITPGNHAGAIITRTKPSVVVESRHQHQEELPKLITASGDIVSPDQHGNVPLPPTKPITTSTQSNHKDNRPLSILGSAPIIAHVTLPFFYAAPIHGYAHGLSLSHLIPVTAHHA